MNSTRNWLRKHRMTALTAATTLTALVVATEFSDAGHWRRRCCCSSTGYSNSNYGYGNYGTSSQGFVNSGYNNSGYNENSPYQYQQQEFDAQAGANVKDKTYSNSPQPNLVDNATQADRTTTNRPIVGDVPPAPDRISGTNQTEQNRTAAERDEQMQKTQQLRQRIETLEQENARLREQLQEARQNNTNHRSDDQTKVNATDKAQGADHVRSDAGIPGGPETDNHADTNNTAD